MLINISSTFQNSHGRRQENINIWDYASKYKFKFSPFPAAASGKNVDFPAIIMNLIINLTRLFEIGKSIWD